MQEPSYTNRRDTMAAKAVGKRWDAETRRKQRRDHARRQMSQETALSNCLKGA